MFTAFFLQEALVEELKTIFKGEKFPDRNGGMSEVSVYEQFLPVIDVNDTEDSQEELESGLLDENLVDRIPVPYIQVILTNGKTSTVNEPGLVSVLLYLCVYDEGKMRNGFQYLLHMIQKIQEHFQKNPILEHYRCGDDILWEISEVDDHPYYFAAMAMDFETATISKEDRYC